MYTIYLFYPKAPSNPSKRDTGTGFYTDGLFMWVIFRMKKQATDQATGQATDQVISLIKVIGNLSLSVKEMMNLLGLNHRPSFRTTYLHPALEGGYIVQIYPEQPSSPKQKYRLTEKGKALLK